MFYAATLGQNDELVGIVQTDSRESAVEKAVAIARELMDPPADNPNESLEQWEQAVRETLYEDDCYEAEKQNGEMVTVTVGYGVNARATVTFGTNQGAETL